MRCRVDDSLLGRICPNQSGGAWCVGAGSAGATIAGVDTTTQNPETAQPWISSLEIQNPFSGCTNARPLPCLALEAIATNRAPRIVPSRLKRLDVAETLNPLLPCQGQTPISSLHKLASACASLPLQRAAACLLALPDVQLLTRKPKLLRALSKEGCSWIEFQPLSRTYVLKAARR
jgi:hypothetical protein